MDLCLYQFGFIESILEKALLLAGVINEDKFSDLHQVSIVTVQLLYADYMTFY